MRPYEELTYTEKLDMFKQLGKKIDKAEEIHMRYTEKLETWRKAIMEDLQEIAFKREEEEA